MGRLIKDWYKIFGLVKLYNTLQLFSMFSKVKQTNLLVVSLFY